MRPIALVSVLATLTLLTLGGPASGQFSGPGGWPAGNTVAAATTLPNDAPVVLEGHIVQQLHRKRYLFRDPTGEITVEIGNKKWMGRRVGPEAKVRLIGKIEKRWEFFGSNEVEVKYFEVLTPAGGAVQPTR
jgi:uncharacterized protein (TIGR00156 family)